MKKIIAILLLLLLSGVVSASWYTSPKNVNTSANVNAVNGAFSGDVNIVGALYVNETSDFLQEAEFSVAIDMTSYETAVDTGISDSNIPGLYFVGNASANQTLTLPAAASADGCSLVFVVKANVGSYNVVIDGDDAETINGAATKTNSDQYSMLEVTSDGTAWYITDSIGTWT